MVQSIEQLKTLTRLLLPAVVACLLPTASLLAAELEEVVVTAQKQAQNLQDVPVSVSAISGEKLAAVGIQRAEDLSAMIPNFSVQQDPILAIKLIFAAFNRVTTQAWSSPYLLLLTAFIAVGEYRGVLPFWM